MSAPPSKSMYIHLYGGHLCINTGWKSRQPSVCTLSSTVLLYLLYRKSRRRHENPRKFTKLTNSVLLTDIIIIDYY